MSQTTSSGSRAQSQPSMPRTTRSRLPRFSPVGWPGRRGSPRRTSGRGCCSRVGFSTETASRAQPSSRLAIVTSPSSSSRPRQELTSKTRRSPSLFNVAQPAENERRSGIDGGGAILPGRATATNATRLHVPLAAPGTLQRTGSADTGRVSRRRPIGLPRGSATGPAAGSQSGQPGEVGPEDAEQRACRRRRIVHRDADTREPSGNRRAPGRPPP